MGYTSDGTANAEVHWGDVAFIENATNKQLLVAYWVKIETGASDGAGAALTKADFANAGWWIFWSTADVLKLQTFGSGALDLNFASSLVNTGWRHVGFWYDNSGGAALRTYVDGVGTVRTPGGAPLGDHTYPLKALCHDGYVTLAECAIWAKPSGLTQTVADAIMAKLANAGGAERVATDVTDLPVTFYAPLYDDPDAVVPTITGTVTHLVDASDHPWVPAGVGVTYYVKTGGNDSADGLTTGTAWATTGKVNTVTLNPNDTVAFHGGDTFSGGLAPVLLNGGDGANPVTFTSYGTGKATIEPVAGTHGFFNDAQQGLVLSNLIFQSLDNLATQTVLTHGIMITSPASGGQRQSCTITGCEAYDFAYAGIAVWGYYSQRGWDNVTITDCVATGNQHVGISVYGEGSSCFTGVTIADCVATDNPGTSGSAPIPNCYGFGITAAGMTGGVVERCTVARNGGASNGGPVGIMLAYCTGVTVQSCEVYDNDSNNTDGGAIDCDHGAIANLVQYNYTHGNRNGALAAYDGHGNTFRYNISENDNLVGIPGTGYGVCSAAAASTGNMWYGNTLYVDTAVVGKPTICGFDEASTGNRFLNNCAISTGSGAYMLAVVANAVTGTVIAGNAYWQIGDTTTFRASWAGGTYLSLPSFRTGTGQETGTGFNVDPLLVNPGAGGTVGDPSALPAGLGGYALTAGSPIAGQGLDLDAYGILNPGLVDFFGATLPLTGRTTLGASLAGTINVSTLLLLLAPAGAEARG